MQWWTVRRLRRAFCLSRPLGALAIIMAAAGLGGCSSQIAALGTPAHGGATVTFESIDGPPPEVFRKLVTALNDEAGAEGIAVVSRSQPATYRIRGYMSALVARKGTSFGWVWDLYDGDKNRVLRVSGEEVAAPAGRRRDAWTAADEQVLRGMSRSGMKQIAAFLNTGAPPPTAAPEPAPPVVMASARDDSPEAAGIVRLFGSDQAAAQADAEPEVEVPLPPHRPKGRRAPASTVGSAPETQTTALIAR